MAEGRERERRALSQTKKLSPTPKYTKNSHQFILPRPKKKKDEIYLNKEKIIPVPKIKKNKNQTQKQNTLTQKKIFDFFFFFQILFYQTVSSQIFCFCFIFFFNLDFGDRFERLSCRTKNLQIEFTQKKTLSLCDVNMFFFFFVHMFFLFPLALFPPSPAAAPLPRLKRELLLSFTCGCFLLFELF